MTGQPGRYTGRPGSVTPHPLPIRVSPENRKLCSTESRKVCSSKNIPHTPVSLVAIARPTIIGAR